MAMKTKVVKAAMEMSEMIFWYAEIERTLRQDFTPDRDGNLSNDQIAELPRILGKHLRTSHNFELLAREAENAYDVIRKMCTFEYSTVKGAEWFNQKRHELVEARDLINV